MAAKRKRFESFTSEELHAKRQNTVPTSTVKNNRKWDKVFRDYLREKQCGNTEYWYYPDEELDSVLSNFWFEARTQRSPLTPEEKILAKERNQDIHPDLYSIASLRNLRNGLSRCLAEHGKHIDLTTDPHFKKSQQSFKDACKELKKLGKGVVHSYPEIDHSGTTLPQTFMTSINFLVNKKSINSLNISYKDKQLKGLQSNEIKIQCSTSRF